MFISESEVYTLPFAFTLQTHLYAVACALPKINRCFGK
jgi:hypothetical protein